MTNAASPFSLALPPSYLHSQSQPMCAKQLQPEHVYIQHSGAVKLDIVDMKGMLADYKCVEAVAGVPLSPLGPLRR